jgi:hypothetical protein
LKSSQSLPVTPYGEEIVLDNKLPLAWRCAAGLEDDIEQLCCTLKRKNFLHLKPAGMRSLILRGQKNALQDWPNFSKSWENLPMDLYMADGGRYRRRRYAVLSASRQDSDFRLEGYQPHFQSVDYNNLNGGILRYYELIEENIIRSTAMSSLLSIGLEVFSRLAPTNDWRIELHQFRIEAHEQRDALPTPEGRHRDGASFVMMVMVERKNVTGGNTVVYGPDGERLDEFMLSSPLYATFVNDEQVFHDVTPISHCEPGEPGQPGHRDMFVAVFHAATRLLR